MTTNKGYAIIALRYTNREIKTMDHDTLNIDELDIEYCDTTTFGDYEISVEPDQDPINPRTDWDQLGTMICWHNRYNLGDEHDYSSHNDFYHQESGLYPDKDYDRLSEEQLQKCADKVYQNGVILPLYLYDHSGITMSTTVFSCPWDSARVGLIYISKEKILKEYGGKSLTKKLRKRVEEYLESEVKIYNYYLTGSVYGYNITKTDSDGEEIDIDSCWGYFGHSTDDGGYMVSVIKDAIKYDITQSSQQMEIVI